MASEIPVVLVVSGTDGLMELEEGKTVEVGSPTWYDWLRVNGSFRFESGFAGEDSFTARKHERDSGDFWYAYRKVEGKLRNAYLGKAESLTVGKMLTVATKLSQSQPNAEPVEQSRSYAKECITADSQVVELQGKVSQLENQLTALQEELAHWKAKAKDAETVIPKLEDKLQLAQEGLTQVKTQQTDFEAARDRALAKLKLGRQAPDYKRAKKAMDLLLGELRGV